MKTKLFFFVAIIMLSGCSLQRQVNKTENKTTEQYNTTESTTTKLEDKTLTSVTETIDTAIVVPGARMVAESAGTMVTAIVDGDTLTANYDKGTNVIRAHFTSAPKIQTFSGTRKTTIQADVALDVSTKIDSSSIVKKDFTTKQKTSKTSYVLFGLGGLIVLLIVLYLLNKRFKLIPLT